MNKKNYVMKLICSFCAFVASNNGEKSLTIKDKKVVNIEKNRRSAFLDSYLLLYQTRIDPDNPLVIKIRS